MHALLRLLLDDTAARPWRALGRLALLTALGAAVTLATPNAATAAERPDGPRASTPAGMSADATSTRTPRD